MNHLTPANIDVSSDDYYKHQVLTSHTFATKSWASFFFTGGLNFQVSSYVLMSFPQLSLLHTTHSEAKFGRRSMLIFQIEHHLFPTVNHCHLRRIQPIVKQVCFFAYLCTNFTFIHSFRPYLQARWSNTTGVREARCQLPRVGDHVGGLLEVHYASATAGSPVAALGSVARKGPLLIVSS